MTDKPADNEPIEELNKPSSIGLPTTLLPPGLERTDTPLLKIVIGLHNTRKGTAAMTIKEYTDRLPHDGYRDAIESTHIFEEKIVCAYVVHTMRSTGFDNYSIKTMMEWLPKYMRNMSVDYVMEESEKIKKSIEEEEKAKEAQIKELIEKAEKMVTHKNG